jgi:hypothetical protein
MSRMGASPSPAGCWQQQQQAAAQQLVQLCSTSG